MSKRTSFPVGIRKSLARAIPILASLLILALLCALLWRDSSSRDESDTDAPVAVTTIPRAPSLSPGGGDSPDAVTPLDPERDPREGPERIAPFPDRVVKKARPSRPGTFLTGPSAKPAVAHVVDFLSENRDQWDLEPGDLVEPVLRSRHTTKHNGVTHLYFRQQLDGIEVYNSDLNANIARDGSLISLHHRFVSGLSAAVNRTEPVLTAEQAVLSAAGELELDPEAPLLLRDTPGGPSRAQVFEKVAGLSRDAIPVRLMYLPLETEEVRLVWNTILHLEDGERWLDLNVDAENGKVLSEANWVASASYEVFPLPLESPSDGGRSTETDPHDLTASPFGWHDTNGAAGAEFTDTRGNNVNAQDDLDADNAGGTRPDGGAGLVFNPALDLADPPGDYLDAAITNLFYWNNICHDVFYHYGFDEDAGNFQANNYGSGGSGGDPVEADAQDGSRVNNANFATPPDGTSPRMQMFRWLLPGSVTVNSPAGIAGSYGSSEASFGSSLSSPLAGSIVIANDGTGSPTLACEPLVNGGAISGNIAFIDRGGCSFVEKVKHAQDAGAIAVIVANHTPGAGHFSMGGDDPTITIPSIMISYEDGQTLRGQIPSPGVSVTMNPTPERDSDLDNGVIIHEYGHGITNRLTGGAANSSALNSTQSRGMGEGWSDFFALCLTAAPSDIAETPRGIGTYLLGQSPAGSGIRPARYTTDMGVNDYTFQELSQGTLSIPHGLGFVWCTMLWEMYWELVAIHGFDPDFSTGVGGNNIALRLVVDGLKLQPANPSFTDARDAILLADQVNNAGANAGVIWAAFARRGLGASAYDGGSANSLDVFEAFDNPDDLQVTPSTRTISTGPIGGPFSPGAIAFSLLNDGGSPLAWTASSGPPWLDLGLLSGNLSAGASVQVTATINGNAAGLSAGIHDATVLFTNSTSGVVLPRTVRLVVSGTSDLIIGPDFDETPDITGFFHIPANPHGAAGPDSLLSTANNVVDLRTKDGKRLDIQSMGTFFPNSVDDLPRICRIHWDPHEERFFVFALDLPFDEAETSQFLLAVSKTASPKTLGPTDWHYATVDAKLDIGGADHLAWLPKVGFDEEAIYITALNYKFSDLSYSGNRLWIVAKGAGGGGLYDGGAASHTVHEQFADTANSFDLIAFPARIYGGAGAGSGVGTFLVGYDALSDGTNDYIQITRINNPLGAVSFTHQYYSLGDVDDTANPIPEIPQAGTPTETGVRTALDGGTRSIDDAAWRNGQLFLTATVRPGGGPDAGQATAHWVRFDTTGVTSTGSPMSSIFVGDQGNIGGEEIAPGTHTFYPSVAPTASGGAKFGFCASGPSIFAGAYVAGRMGSDPAGTMRPVEAVKEGEDFYTRTFQSDPDADTNENSWGEPGSITIDPEDEDYFWAFNTYARTRGTGFSIGGGPVEDGRWGTAWGLCTFKRNLIINEVDALTLENDTLEFIEIYDGGAGNTSLDGFAIVLFDGATDTSYAAFDLDGHSTDANGFFVLGNADVPNVDLVIPDQVIENGADAVALYQGDASQFPAGASIVVSGELVDAVVHDTGQPDDSGLLALLDSGQPQLNEVTDAVNTGFHSLQRRPDGAGGARNTSSFQRLAPTPGATNDIAPAPSAPDLLSSSDTGESSTDNLTRDDTPTVAGTGGRPGATLRVYSDIQGAQGFGVVQADGTWEITLFALNDGTHVLTAYADASPGSPTLTIMVDTAAPAAPSVPDMTPGTDSGISSTDNITNDTTPGFGGNKPAGTSLNLYRAASPSDVVIGSVASNGMTTWSLTSASLPEAGFNVYATASDAAGNESSASAPLPVTIDTTSPSLTVNQAAGQADPASSDPVLFTAAVSENAHGLIANDFSFLGSLGGSRSLSGGPATFTITFTTSGNEGTVGTSVAAGKFTDAAGNPNLASTSTDNFVQLDTHGGSGEAATALVFSGGGGSGDSASESGWLQPGDVDSFSFTLASHQLVTIATTGNVDTWGVLTDSDSNVLNDPASDHDAGPGANLLIETVLAPGTYRLEVSPTGSATSGTYGLTIDLADPPVLINELQTNTELSDTLEFIELFDSGVGNKSLAGHVLVFFRGSDETSYLAVDLDGHSTDADGFFVVGSTAVAGVDLVIPDASIRNGRDAVALYSADGTDFPNGTAATTTDLVDAVVYLDEGQSQNSVLASLLLAAQPHPTEAANGFVTGQSLQRMPDGAGGARVTEDFLAVAPTPGAPNQLPGAPGVPDLAASSDSGDSSLDDLTRNTLPRITGTATPGSLVRLTSNRDGVIGIAPCFSDGTYVLDPPDFALSEGIHTILPTTVSSSSDGPTLALEIDITPPSVPSSLDLITDTGVSPTDDVTNDNTPTFEGLADSGTTVHLLVDGAVYGGASGAGATRWSHTISGATPLPDGSRNIKARSIDPAGNVSADSPVLPIEVDTQSPGGTLTLAAGQGNPASSGPVEFTAGFNEPVHGFTIGDVQVSGSAAGGAALSGGPTSFTVSVSATVTEGFVTAAVGGSVATDLAGNPNTPLGASAVRVDLDSFDGFGGTATEIPLSSGIGSVSGYVHPGDSDLFSFTLTEPRIAEIFTTGSTDTLGRLRNSLDILLNDPVADDDSGTGDNFRIRHPLPRGVYTVEVLSTGGSDGDYDLHIEALDLPHIQPDLVLSGRGDDVYAPTPQVLPRTSKKAKPVTAVVNVENDGEIPDSFLVSGRPGNNLFRVAYTNRDDGNITAGLVTGLHQTPVINPGDPAYPIVARVTPNKKKIAKTKKYKKKGKKKKKTIYLKKKYISVLNAVSDELDTREDLGVIRVQTK